MSHKPIPGLYVPKSLLEPGNKLLSKSSTHLPWERTDQRRGPAAKHTKLISNPIIKRKMGGRTEGRNLYVLLSQCLLRTLHTFSTLLVMWD